MDHIEQSMILIADDDFQLRTALSKFLAAHGHRTAIAADGNQALELFAKLRPQVVVADMCMPGMTGIGLLEELRKNEPAPPVIIITAHPDMESAINALHHGAFDYLTKPFAPEVLLQKIGKALSSNRLISEHAVLTELVSLHEMTCRLTASNTLDDLLDAIFKVCVETVHAEHGLIHLLSQQTRQLHLVRPRAGTAPPIYESAALDLSPFTAWVLAQGKPILMAEGKLYPQAQGNFPQVPGSAMWIPLMASGQVMGIITLTRGKQQVPFSVVELNTIDLLAAQAGIALNNAHLYRSINQKLSELSLISTYSEQLMGMIDEKAVIQCLFETAARHFPLDVVAFLVVKKRAHTLLYWTRGEVGSGALESVLSETIALYNRNTGLTLNEKRGKATPILLPVTTTLDPVHPPFVFEQSIAMCDEDFDYGVVYFGACQPVENTAEKIALLASLVSQTRIALINAKLYVDMKENYIRTIKALAIAVDAKDTYTHGHSENVMHIAEEIAREMGIDEKTIDIIRNAGLLHDIGKIGVPGYVLNKTGPLTYDEFNGIMKSHSMMGANIVKDVPFLTDLYQLILYHHEHYNGGGYPEGLQGVRIPMGARIIHAADAFEAMTSDRPYRKSLGTGEAVKRLQEGRGIQFDPDVVDAFLKVARRKGWVEN